MVNLYRIILAANLLLSALTANASSPEVVNQLLSKGDYENALLEAESGLAADSENTRLLLQKGFILIRLRRLDQAEEFYLNLIQSLPHNPEPLNNLGVIYQLKREYGKAIETFSETIAKFPKFSRAYENLGDTYIQVARETYVKGKNQSPSDEMLGSKADLSQRFYRLAKENLESATTTADPSTKQPLKLSKAQMSKPGTVSEDGSRDNIMDFLRSWSVDWSKMDINAYFDHYDVDFVPSGGLDLATWKMRKSRVFSEAEYIRIRVESIKVLEFNQNQATLSFTQHYKSNTHQETSNKTLMLKRHNDHWRITKEF